MVGTDKVVLGMEQRRMLVQSAASRLWPGPPDEFDARLLELMTLLPDLVDRLATLQPSLVVELCSCTPSIALRLVKLKAMFPTANVSVMTYKRPWMLLDREWPGVEEGARKLAGMFPEGGVDEMVSQQPLLLTADVDEVIGDLERFMPGVNVQYLITRNPGILMSLQRGVAVLGPGAEFM